MVKETTMNEIRFKLNQQAIDPTAIDGQDRDLLAEIETLTRTQEESATALMGLLGQMGELTKAVREALT